MSGLIYLQPYIFLINLFYFSSRFDVFFSYYGGLLNFELQNNRNNLPHLRKLSHCNAILIAKITSTHDTVATMPNTN